MIGIQTGCAERYSHCAIYLGDTEPSYREAEFPAYALSDLGKTYHSQVLNTAYSNAVADFPVRNRRYNSTQYTDVFSKMFRGSGSTSCVERTRVLAGYDVGVREREELRTVAHTCGACTCGPILPIAGDERGSLLLIRVQKEGGCIDVTFSAKISWMITSIFNK